MFERQADSRRHRMRPSWRKEKTTLASESASRVYRRWIWHIGNGERSATTPRRGSNFTNRSLKCLGASRKHVRSSCGHAEWTWGQLTTRDIRVRLILRRQLSHSFGGLSMSPAPSNSSSPPPGPSYPSSIPPQPAFSLPHPSSTSWQTADNLLPPPPPPPILRSGGIQTQARPPPRTSSTTSYDTPKRVTRSQTGATPGRGPIGDAERNPYKSTGGTRKDGGVV